MNKEVEKAVEELSPVKKQIGRMFLNGKSENFILKTNRQAFVTMVKNAIRKADKGFFEKRTEKKEKRFDIGEGKQRVRTVVTQEVGISFKKYKVISGIILTLSWYLCLTEKMINSFYPKFKFLSYEMDKQTYATLKDNIKINKWKFMLNPIFGKIFDGVIKAVKNQYAHLFFDFCGGLETHEQDIKLALQNDIVGLYGIVWITLSTRSTTPNYHTIEELKKIINEFGGGRYDDIHWIPYSDPTVNNDKGANMIAVILRRMK